MTLFSAMPELTEDVLIVCGLPLFAGSPLVEVDWVLSCKTATVELNACLEVIEIVYSWEYMKWVINLKKKNYLPGTSGKQPSKLRCQRLVASFRVEFDLDNVPK